ncbi:MAG: flavin reductase family protein [Chloroflexi bacterium]|nr:flavin reductase family protein [Chloroflexota bacterium]
MLKVVAEHPGAFYQHYPRVAAIVTVNSSGRKNAMAVAWHSSVSFKPPLYGISIAPKRYTYQLISESKQFGVNFVPYERAETIAAVGGSNGGVINKFSEFNIAEDKPVKTEVPILKDAYTAYECKVIENKVYGDHAWIIGEIVAVHMAENVFQENGMLDLSLIRPALYIGGETYCSTDKSTVKFLDREKYGKK